MKENFLALLFCVEFFELLHYFRILQKSVKQFWVAAILFLILRFIHTLQLLIYHFLFSKKAPHRNDGRLAIISHLIVHWEISIACETRSIFVITRCYQSFRFRTILLGAGSVQTLFSASNLPLRRCDSVMPDWDSLCHSPICWYLPGWFRFSRITPPA